MTTAEAAASASASAAQSVLRKPLMELTEDDIAQLTREDCRRFLKDKGMRRPSWNKSQAIQQVISLKALLEGRTATGDSPSAAATIRRKPPPISPPSADPPPEPTPYRRKDPIATPYATGGAATCRPEPPPESAVAAGTHPSPRVVSDALAEQMTIFYAGDVSVINGVPPDKARAILALAATPDGRDDAPNWIGPAEPASQVEGSGTLPPTESATGRSGHHHIGELAEEWRTAAREHAHGPANRKASLQRYLEKRKDRGRIKGNKISRGPSSNVEMIYYGQKFKDHIPDGLPSRCDTPSLTHPRPPRTPTRCSLIDNQAQRIHMSFDLNEDGSGN